MRNGTISFEGVVADKRHVLSNRDFTQGTPVFKGIAANGYHFIRDIKRVLTGNITKRILSYISHPFGYADISQ